MASNLHFPQSIPLEHWGVLAVKGADAKPFLQGQLTVQMDDIQPTLGSLGAYCNLKGRLHGLFYIINAELIDEGYLLIMPQSIVPHMLKVLKKFAMFSKVSLEDASKRYALLGIIDKDINQALNVSFEKHFETTKLAEDCLALYLPFHRALIVAPASVEKTKNNGSIWDDSDIQAGIPFITEPTLESFLPHYLNLDKLGCLNFSKGCYLGQEIIARMEYKGNIKKHLYRAFIKHQIDIPNGSEIVVSGETRSVGNLLYSAQKAQGMSCLITIQDSLIDSELQLNYGDKVDLCELEPIEGF